MSIYHNFFQIPKTTCRKVATEQKTTKKKCQTIRNPKGVKRNCKRVGVGRPKKIPRVTPTIVCSVG